MLKNIEKNNNWKDKYDKFVKEFYILKNMKNTFGHPSIRKMGLHYRIIREFTDEILIDKISLVYDIPIKWRKKIIKKIRNLNLKDILIFEINYRKLLFYKRINALIQHF